MNWLSPSLKTIVLLAKNPAFKEEREWRLIATLPESDADELVRFRLDEGALVPYLPIRLAQADGRVPFSSVHIGPAAPDLAEESMTMFLRSNGLREIQIGRSVIPLR